MSTEQEGQGQQGLNRVLNRREFLCVCAAGAGLGVGTYLGFKHGNFFLERLINPLIRYCEDLYNYYGVYTNRISPTVLADGMVEEISPRQLGSSITSSMNNFSRDINNASQLHLGDLHDDNVSQGDTNQIFISDAGWVVRPEIVDGRDIESEARDWIREYGNPFIPFERIDQSTVSTDLRNRTGFPYVFLGLETERFSNVNDNLLRSSIVRLYIRIIFGQDGEYRPTTGEQQVAANMISAFKLITGLSRDIDVERFIHEMASGEMSTIRLGDINHVIEQLIMQYRNGEEIDVSAIQLDDINPALANPFLRTWAAVDNATNHVYQVAIMVAGAATSLFRRNPTLNSLVYNMDETAQVIAYEDTEGNLVIYVMREPCGLNPTGVVVRKVEVTPTNTPTDTPNPPTDTPEYPTDTPEQPTDTPEYPTDTPEYPTDTPEYPTDTPPPPPDTVTPQIPKTATHTPPPGEPSPQPTKKGSPTPTGVPSTPRPTVPVDPTSTNSPPPTETPKPDPTNTSEPPATPTSERERPHPGGTPVSQDQSNILSRFLARRGRAISRGEGDQSFAQFLVMCAEIWGMPVNKVRLLLATAQVLIKTLMS